MSKETKVRRKRRSRGHERVHGSKEGRKWRKDKPRWDGRQAQEKPTVK